MAAKMSKNRLCKVLRMVTHKTKGAEKIIDRHVDTRRGKDLLLDDDTVIKGATAELRTLRYYASRLPEGVLEMTDPRTVVSSNGAYRVYVTALSDPAQCPLCGAIVGGENHPHREWCDATKPVKVEDEGKFEPDAALTALLQPGE